MNKKKLLDKFKTKNLVILLRNLLSSFIKRLPNILIILIVGLITRHLVYICSDINVFIEYTNPISLFYYFNFSWFTVCINSIDCSGIRLKYILKCINWDNLKFDSIINGILSFINDYGINTSNMHWHGYYNSTDKQIGCSNDNTINKYSVMAMNKSGENLSGNNTHRTRSLKRNIDFTLSDDDRLKGSSKRACTIKGNIEDNLNKNGKEPQKDISKELSKVKRNRAWKIKNPDYKNIRSVEATKKYTQEYIESLEKRGIDRENILAILKMNITRGNKNVVPVWLQNLEGDKIKLYPSIEKCAEDLKVKPQTIKSAIKVNGTVQHKFKIRKVNLLDLELSEEQRKEIAETRQKGTVVSVIDSKGKVQVFNSILEASIYLGEPRWTVRRYVDKNVGFKKGSEVYTLRKGNLLNEDLSREVDQVVKTRRVGITVTVTDSRGISQVFLSLRDASKYLGVSVGNLSENYLDKNVGFRKGSEFYTIRKGDVRDEHFSGMGEIFERVKKSNGTTIWATDSKGNTKIFKSINDASVFFKKSYKNFYNTYLDKDISILKKGESYKITRGNLVDQNKTSLDHEIISDTSNRENPIIVSASQGKYEMEFTSLTDAAKYLKIDHKEIEPIVDKKATRVIKGEFYSFRTK